MAYSISSPQRQRDFTMENNMNFLLGEYIRLSVIDYLDLRRRKIVNKTIINEDKSIYLLKIDYFLIYIYKFKRIKDH